MAEYPPSFHSTTSIREEGTKDDLLLDALGKTPELERVYSFWTLCGYQITMMSSWSCLIMLYPTIFDLGGPVGLLYGTIIVAVFQTLLMASLAELSSVWPTAGGQQYFTFALASPRIRPILSYIVGWSVLLGEIANGAGCATNSANIIAEFVSILYPELEWQTWMTFLIYLACITIPIAFNIAPRILPALNTFGAAFTIASLFAWAVSFLIKSSKHDASFVFTQFINNSGYKSNGWVFIMSFYNPMYALYGTDAVLHMVEDMKDAARDAPRVMVWSMIFSGFTTFGAAIILLFCAGNIEVNQSSDTVPVSWFIDALGNVYGGGIFCILLLAIANILVVVGTNTAASRLAWSMARDGAFPRSPYLAHVSERFRVPLRAMVAILVVSALIGLVIFGGGLAFNVIISGAGVSFQLGYAIPIILLLCRGRSFLPSDRKFSLGRQMGYIINILSVLWSMLIIIVYLCPLYVPVDSSNLANMNWAPAILGLEILVAGLFWFFSARYTYIREPSAMFLETQVQLDGQSIAKEETGFIESHSNQSEKKGAVASLGDAGVQ